MDGITMYRQVAGPPRVIVVEDIYDLRHLAVYTGSHRPADAMSCVCHVCGFGFRVDVWKARAGGETVECPRCLTKKIDVFYIPNIHLAYAPRGCWRPIRYYLN